MHANTHGRELYRDLTAELPELRLAVEQQPHIGTRRYAFSIALEQAATCARLLGDYRAARAHADERLALWKEQPREQVRAACAAAANALALGEPATEYWRHLEQARTAGFSDLGLLRLELARYPQLDQPELRALMKQIAHRPEQR
jgi:hypothetical protein